MSSSQNSYSRSTSLQWSSKCVKRKMCGGLTVVGMYDSSRMRPRLNSGPEASGEPLSPRRGLHNCSGPNTSAVITNLPRVIPIPNSVKKQDEVSTASRQTVKRFSNPETFRSTDVISETCRRHQILERTGEGVLRRSQTLQPHLKKSEDDNKCLRTCYGDTRSSTLPAVGRNSKQIIGKYCSNFLETRRVSRQDILNRRTSFEAPRTPIQVAIRRKSSSLLEPSGRVNISERKDETRQIDRSNKPSFAYLKNATRNTGKGREGSLGRRTGARSVADFLPVSSRFQDITRGLVPIKSSTLPKIVHTGKRVDVDDSGWYTLRGQKKESANREAPIYGRIRRRKYSVPAVSRESFFRRSAKSLRALADNPNANDHYNEKIRPDCNKISPKVMNRSSSSKSIFQQIKPDLEESELKTQFEKETKSRIIKRERLKSEQDYETTNHGRESSKRGVNESEIEVIPTVRKTSDTESYISTCHNIKSNAKDSRNRQEPRNGFKNMVTSTTLPVYIKRVRKTSSCTSSSIPLRVPSRTLENRQSIETKFIRSKSKLVKDRIKCIKKLRLSSLNDISNTRSLSPAPSSSIFGFCTGRRRVSGVALPENSNAQYLCWKSIPVNQLMQKV